MMSNKDELLSTLRDIKASFNRSIIEIEKIEKDIKGITCLDAVTLVFNNGKNCCFEMGMNNSFIDEIEHLFLIYDKKDMFNSFVYLYEKCEENNFYSSEQFFWAFNILSEKVFEKKKDDFYLVLKNYIEKIIRNAIDFEILDYFCQILYGYNVVDSIPVLENIYKDRLSLLEKKNEDKDGFYKDSFLDCICFAIEELKKNKK